MPEFPELSDIVPECHSRLGPVRWLFNRRIELVLRLARLDGPEPLDVLDLGCGEGLTLRRLRQRHPRHRLSGLDHNPHVAEIEIPGVEVRVGDLTVPGALPKAAYDRILCLDVLEHIEDLGPPLGSVREALRPGGLLVISAPTENLFHKLCRFLIKGTFSEREGPASSPHYHRAKTLRARILAQGFSLEASAHLPLPGPAALSSLYAFRKQG